MLGGDLRWLEAILRHVEPGTSGNVFRTSDGSGAEVLLPLVHVNRDPLFRQLTGRVYGLPPIRFIDRVDIHLPQTPDASQRLRAALVALGREQPWDVLVLPRVSPRSALLHSLPGSGFAMLQRDAGSTAYCDVSRPDALGAISKEKLRNTDRLTRRARRDYGDVAVETVIDAAGIDAAFERFVRLEDTGWKGLDGVATSLARDHGARAFYQDLLRSFARNSDARLDLLTLGGRDAAAQFAVRSGQAWFLLKIGFHPEFKDVGPGTILFKHLLDETIAAPDISEVNLTTNPQWAQRWHLQTEPSFTTYIFGQTLRGRLLSTSRILKRLRDRWRSLHRAAEPPALP